MKDPAKLLDIDIQYRLILSISIVYRHQAGCMHARMHAESVGKRLNWSDYPLVHKEIATSIS